MTTVSLPDESPRFIEGLLLIEESRLLKATEGDPYDMRTERLAMVRRALRWLDRIEAPRLPAEPIHRPGRFTA